MSGWRGPFRPLGSKTGCCGAVHCDAGAETQGGTERLSSARLGEAALSWTCTV